jgi:hypothetical protein
LSLEEEVRGMGVAELRRLRQLEDENRRLKRLAVDLTHERLNDKYCRIVTAGRIEQCAGPVKGKDSEYPWTRRANDR